jgi:hypothetical protein
MKGMNIGKQKRRPFLFPGMLVGMAILTHQMNVVLLLACTVLILDFPRFGRHRG